MISLIVTAYEDPKSTEECINRLLNQEKFGKSFELIVACPDEPTKKVIMGYKKKHPRVVKYVKQEYGSGKNKLMNEIMKIAKGDILIWTDGNKFVEKDAIKQIIKKFEDPAVGCVGGRPVPQNKRDNLFGFWAHLLTNAAHKLRETRFRKGKFVEQCANLLAIKKGILREIPLDVAEDSIIPYLITQKGYKNIYQPDAKVYVMYPRSFSDWTKQKIRSAKAHEAMNNYVFSKEIKQKSFMNEIVYGFLFVFSFPKNMTELYWTLLLYPARLYIWLRSFYEIKVKKETYNASWSRSESTKSLEYQIENGYQQENKILF